MPTRFYLPSSGAAAVSPALDPNGVWEHESGFGRRPMSTSKTGTAFLSNSLIPDGVDHLVDADSLFLQFIGPSLAAQVLAVQTVKWQILASEQNVGNNCFTTLELFICSQDGLTIKETLLVITRDTVNELTTSLVNRSFSATTSAATLEEGDRIVANMGIGGLPTATSGTQGHNGALRFGDIDTVDLPEDDVATADDNPWLEFANALLFPTSPLQPEAARLGTNLIVEPNRMVGY